MEDMGSIHLRLLEGRLGEVACQFTKVQYSSFRLLEAWHPAIPGGKADETDESRRAPAHGPRN